MTQPPGPYRQPAPQNQPTPYGQPAPQDRAAPYGHPVPQNQPIAYGQPVPQGQQAVYGRSTSYGGPGGYGPPPQPPQTPKKSLLPWLIVAGAVLVSGIGIAVVVLLTGGNPGTENRAATEPTTSAPATTSSASPSREPAGGDLPGGAQVADPTTAVAGNSFPGSDQVALTWVDALADGEWQTAYDLSCTEVQDASIAAAAGGDPAYELGRYFYEQVLGGVGFTGGTFDSMEHDDVTGTDRGVFTLDLENGGTFTLLVYVQEDLTVCDFF